MDGCIRYAKREDMNYQHVAIATDILTGMYQNHTGIAQPPWLLNSLNLFSLVVTRIMILYCIFHTAPHFLLQY